MYCKRCGNGIEEDSKFCSECGERVVSRGSFRDDIFNNTPMLRLRSVFVPGVALLSTIPLQLFMTVWAGGFFGGFAGLGADLLGVSIPREYLFIFFGGTAFLCVPLFSWLSRRRRYAVREYVFYSDRLEYSGGTPSAGKKTIRYQEIKGVSVRQGVLQRRHGLGTIVLSIPSEGGRDSVVMGGERSQEMHRRRKPGGMRIPDIEEPQEVYRKILELTS